MQIIESYGFLPYLHSDRGDGTWDWTLSTIGEALQKEGVTEWMRPMSWVVVLLVLSPSTDGK